MSLPLGLRAAVVSVALFVAFVLAWHVATRGSGPVAQMDPEYAKLMGATATQGKSPMPGPLDAAANLWDHANRRSSDTDPTAKGLGIKPANSIARVRTAYSIPAPVAIRSASLSG